MIKSLPLKYTILSTLFIAIFSISTVAYTSKSNAFLSGLFGGASCLICSPLVINCAKGGCVCASNNEKVTTIEYMTDSFIEHRKWFIESLWEAHTLPALMLMTEQITTSAIQQAMMIGTLFDAKHQLESQRLLQTLEAEAHSAYQVGEGMCTFGTMTRSIANTERRKDITQINLADRSSQRQSLNGDGISAGGAADDFKSRFEEYINVYCHPSEMGGSIAQICNAPDQTRVFKDINFTALSQSNNLNLDFTNPAATADEADVLALQANLYGHRVLPSIPENKFALDASGEEPLVNNVETYFKMRGLLAKRSIAQASFAAYVAERTEMDASVQPYMEAVLKEMGISEAEAQDLLGFRPSYYTQMKFMTNTMYQTPNFYADLYSTPENVDRKIVSMQALNLKLRYDAYESHSRKNMNLAATLEALVDQYEDKYLNEAKSLQESGDILNLPGLGN